MCVRVLTLLIRQAVSKKSPRVRGGFFSVLVSWGIVGWIYVVSGMGLVLEVDVLSCEDREAN